MQSDLSISPAYVNMIGHGKGQHFPKGLPQNISTLKCSIWKSLITQSIIWEIQHIPNSTLKFKSHILRTLSFSDKKYV